MKQANLIKISKFQVDSDGGLLLFSEADGLPFLEVDEKGTAFDAGPFTGAFCALEGLSKFIVKGERDSACSVYLKFAEGDVYPIGKFHFSDEQYSGALHWAITANKKIELKKGNKEGYPGDLAKAVISMIAKCLEMDKGLFKSDTFLENVIDSGDRKKLIWMAKERYSIVVPDNSILPITTIRDVIDLVNAQVEDKTDFLERPGSKIEDISMKHVRTA